MGKVSTHAVVYARLITDGEDHGIHGMFQSIVSNPGIDFVFHLFMHKFHHTGFIVQLRSLDDHSPLPGITVGDIGMKFGSGAYNTVDNGVLSFDHVRIPRNQMLMRFVLWPCSLLPFFLPVSLHLFCF